MKRMSVAAMVLALTVSLLSTADAGIRKSMGGGCGDCAQHVAPSDPFRKFQADTIDLRQEMMTKRFELQRENLKGIPDREKVASLQGDIKTLQSKIMEVRSQSGLPADKGDGECGLKGGLCKIGTGGCGKGMGDCTTGPCVPGGGRK